MSWNGTDLKQGIVLNSSALASDRPVDDIPVARLGSADPFADFQTNTYIYPNPVSGSVGKVRIYVPFQGRPLARGMYWAVFRCEETIGGRNIVQAVKKILLP